MGNQEKEMSFLDHAEVLRWHLIRATVVILIFSSVVFIFKGIIFDIILFAPKEPTFITYRIFCAISTFFNTEGLCIEEIPFTFQSLAMAEQFRVHIWTSITIGFIVSFPYVLWEFWRFISPGLHLKERKNARKFIIISSFLFFIGILFGYYVVTPLSVNFLGNYTVSNAVAINIQIGSYIALLRTSLLASGFIFELPIIIYFLASMGLVTPETLRKHRKIAIVLVLVIAAVITPPDVISQIIVAIPIITLYEMSIFITKIIVKKEKKKKNAELY